MRGATERQCRPLPPGLVSRFRRTVAELGEVITAAGLTQQHVATPLADSGDGAAKPATPLLPPPDGPMEPNLFYWNGRRVQLEPLPWRLLEHLWGYRYSRKPRQRLAVGEAVWGHDPSDDSFKSAMKRINTPLAEESIPITACSKSGHVWLEGPWTAAN
jgi:hypothetical protein